jgi:Leucine-rich repeat (LRR) protein
MEKTKFLLCLLYGIFSLGVASAQDNDIDRCQDATTYYSLEEALSESEEVLKLDIAMLKLTSIPSEIEKLINLECLDLSFNKITTLPIEFKQLQKLRVLDLKGTRFLQKLPPVVAELPNLELVDLRNHPEWNSQQFKEAVNLLPGVQVLID